MVLARIIEPVSKLDSLRVLEEVGVAAASYRSVKRRLPTYTLGGRQLMPGVDLTGRHALNRQARIARRTREVSGKTLLWRPPTG